MNYLYAALVTCAFLVACGGGGSPSVPAPVVSTAMVHPSDRAVPADGFRYNIRTVDDGPVEQMVAQQATLPGQVILWPGRTRDFGFATFDWLLAQAARYPNITHVYVYDELGWKNGVIDMQDATAAHTAALQAKAYGYRTVVTIIPSVLLSPQFRVPDLNAYSVIVLDPYPAVGGMGVAGIPWKGNLMSSLLHGSVTKLRAEGFAGEIWYAYQAFCVAGRDPAQERAEFVAQRETIADAAALGITGIAPFGLYLGTSELAREPWLIPGSTCHSADLLTP